MGMLLDQAGDTAEIMPAINELEPEPIDPAHLSAVLEGLAQAERREFATPEQMEAIFRRFEA